MFDEINEEGLIEAIKKEDISLVEQYIEQGANFDKVDEAGKTALMYAAEKGYTDIVKLLIEKGVMLDVKDEFGWTALMYAVRAGHLETVKYLVEQGANKDEKDNKSLTALIIGLRHLEIEKHLIKSGANLSEEDLLTILDSVWKLTPEIVESLVECGVDIDEKYINGKKVLDDKIIKRWDPKLLKNWRNKIHNLVLDKDKFDDEGKTKLMKLIEDKENGKAKILIKRGANLNLQDKQGKDILTYIRENGNVELLKLAIEKGININDKDSIMKEFLENQESEVRKMINAAEESYNDITKEVEGTRKNSFVKIYDEVGEMEKGNKSPEQGVKSIKTILDNMLENSKKFGKELWKKIKEIFDNLLKGIKKVFGISKDKQDLIVPKENFPKDKTNKIEINKK